MIDAVLHLPPFDIRVRSPLPGVAEHLAYHYPGAGRLGGGEFVDFDIEVVPASGLRRWWRPQARFLLDGIEPFFPLPVEQAAPMFEWGLNWCVAQRALGYLVLHAAVVERDGMALVMPGFPGAGKSTLCAALTHLEGWRLLSDELAILDPERGVLLPHPRPIGVKNDSIDIVRAFAGSRVGPTYLDTRKGRVAHVACPAASMSRAGEPALPAWVVFPHFVESAALAIEGVTRVEAFTWISEQSFNKERMGELGFAGLCRLLDRSSCHELTYGSTRDAVAGIRSICARGAAQPLPHGGSPAAPGPADRA
ncbi:MAG: HprK-related kinase A [Burkholderiales bacterium]|nr:HprK-related kinase A [Burkholderiales bacterium]